MPLLDVKDLRVHFPIGRGVFGASKQTIKAVDGVTLHVDSGETVGLVGESGCGKSTLGRAIIRLIEPTAGTVMFNGRNLRELSRSELRAQRRHFQMVFQDPFSSLNPRMTVEQILGEALQIHRMVTSRKDRSLKVVELLRQVGLDPNHAGRYPHEFSGGQRQRIGIARALAVRPNLIVCDEPVSALDVSIQAQIVNLLVDIRTQFGLAYLFIAHDLAVVEHISERILVMYLGRIVESGPAREVIRQPKHPYTQALISSVPALDAINGRKRILLGGELPSPINPPSGCPFHPRCPVAQPRCSVEVPSLRKVGDARMAACHFA